MKAKGKRQRAKVGARKMRLLCAWLLPLFFSLPFTFYLLPLAFPVLADSNNISTATVEGRLAVFDDVWETVRDRYYDPRLRGLDWEAEREKFRPLAAEAKTTAELYTVL